MRRSDNPAGVSRRIAASFDSTAEERFYAESVVRLANLPGIAAVTDVGNGLAFTDESSSSWYLRAEDQGDMKRRHTASQRDVLPNYSARALRAS